MKKTDVSLLLENYIQYDVKEYIIDEQYIEIYKECLILSQENEEIVRKYIGAKIHNVSSIESNDYWTKLTIRAHITFNGITYTLLALVDRDVDIITMYPTNEIINSICTINLPEEELQLLREMPILNNKQ